MLYLEERNRIAKEMLDHHPDNFSSKEEWQEFASQVIGVLCGFDDCVPESMRRYATHSDNDKLMKENDELKTKVEDYSNLLNRTLDDTLELHRKLEIENEECAKVAESMPDGMWNHGLKIAKAIRSRKEHAEDERNE